MQKAYEFDFVYDTQAAFRLLLEALSNPGRIVELGPLARKLGGAVHCAILIKARLSFCAQRICRQASCSGSAGPGSRLSRKSLCARNCRRLWGNVMSRNMSIRWALIFLCWISGAA